MPQPCHPPVVDDPRCAGLIIVLLEVARAWREVCQFRRSGEGWSGGAWPRGSTVLDKTEDQVKTGACRSRREPSFIHSYRRHTMARTAIQPVDMADPRPRYTHGWRVGNTVYVAGQLALDKDGSLVGPNDIRAKIGRAH